MDEALAALESLAESYDNPNFYDEDYDHDMEN